MLTGWRCTRLALGAGFLVSVVACTKTASPVSNSTSLGQPKPTPTGVAIGAPTSKSIGPAGGELASPDGQLTVVAPPGALGGTVGFSVQEITNYAPGAIGNAYRLGPAGSRFSVPVELVFLVDLPTDIEAVTVSYQDEASGFWLHAPSITRDPVAHTLTVATSHFSDWSIVTQPTAQDLNGTFTLTQTVDIPFTASGAGTFNFAGSNSYENFYLFPGTVTVPTPIQYGALTCTPNAVGGEAPDGGPTFTLLPQSLVELVVGAPSGTVLYFGINAQWSLSCSAPSGNQSTELMSTEFDTYGINLLGCSRSYVGTPVAGPDYCQGTYTIDCGTDGVSTATWQFQSASCGQACTPSLTGNICDSWALNCTSGTAICADTGTANPAANGTSCGTNMVCDAGACLACTAGVACTPSNPCDVGNTSCSTGASVCMDTGTAVANGTACGSGMVCSAGVCVGCTTGVACAPANPCDVGTTSCSTGTSVCTDTGTAQPNGTTCGTNMVCNAGACVACTAGVSCTPLNPCDAGTTSCSTGASLCVDTGTALANGTACGTGMVCSGGACVSCVAGLACTPANPCDAGTTSCGSGSSTCADTGTALANGTSCGTNQVCNNGSCVACAAGSACTPANPCDLGTTSCGTGTPVCADTGVPVPVVTPCGTALVCNGGACVASQTVTGTRYVTYWPDSGPLAPAVAPDVTISTVAVVMPAGTTWVTYPGAFAPDGSFAIPNVPAVAYTLVFVDGSGFSRIVETSSATVDLGYDVLGRSDVTFPTASTLVTLDITGGLAPWDPAGDEVELVSSNADVFDFPVSGTAIVAGATTGSAVEDWFASAIGGPLYLLESGDTVTLSDLSTSSFTVGASSYPYQAATAGASLSNVATPAAITAALAVPETTAGQVTVDWDLGQFESLLPIMGPAATEGPTPHTLLVGAYAQVLGTPAPLPRVLDAPVLLRLQVAGAGPGSSLTAPAPLEYAHVLDPSLWDEWRNVDFEGQVSYTASGATSPVIATASVGRTEPVGSATTPIDPTLTPAQSPLVNGLNAFSPLTGVGTTPTLAWNPPATGSPTSYTVEIFSLRASAGASVSARLASLTTSGTAIQIPPGLLVSGTTYYARITATQPIAPGADNFATAPNRFNNVYAYASLLTGTFAP